MFEFLQDMNNYDQRVVGRDTVKGITISTCYTSDEGYESALIDKSDVHPVERYEDTESAIAGHAKWLKFSEHYDGEPITKLGGMGGWVGDETGIILDL